jgi:hypothetical protein
MLIKFTFSHPKITMNCHFRPHLYGSQARTNRVVHKGPAASGIGSTHSIVLLLVLEHQLRVYGSDIGIV